MGDHEVVGVDAIAATRSDDRSTLPAAVRRVGGVLVAALCASLLIAYVAVWVSDGAIAVDFEAAFRAAAADILAGRSPYTTDLAELDAGAAYVYPPLTALVAILFTPLSGEAASAAVTLLLVGAVIWSLLLLGVRDWRCHAVVLAWPATLSGLQTGNVSIPLLLAVALAWRYRAGTGSAIALGVSFAVKPLLWPLLPWLWCRGSRRHAIGAVVVGAVVVAVSWAVIGFAGVAEYPGIVRDITRLQETEAYSVFAFTFALGLPELIARLLGLAIAVGLLVGSVVWARRGADAVAFSLGIAAVLAFTPVVWLHYFVLLAAAVAVTRPRLSWPWLVPLVTWASVPPTAGTPREMALVLGMAVLLVAATSRPPRADR